MGKDDLDSQAVLRGSRVQHWNLATIMQNSYMLLTITLTSRKPWKFKVQCLVTCLLDNDVAILPQFIKDKLNTSIRCSGFSLSDRLRKIRKIYSHWTSSSVVLPTAKIVCWKSWIVATGASCYFKNYLTLEFWNCGFLYRNRSYQSDIVCRHMVCGAGKILSRWCCPVRQRTKRRRWWGWSSVVNAARDV